MWVENGLRTGAHVRPRAQGALLELHSRQALRQEPLTKLIDRDCRISLSLASVAEPRVGPSREETHSRFVGESDVRELIEGNAGRSGKIACAGSTPVRHATMTNNMHAPNISENATIRNSNRELSTACLAIPLQNDEGFCVPLVLEAQLACQAELFIRLAPVGFTAGATLTEGRRNGPGGEIGLGVGCCHDQEEGDDDDDGRKNAHGWIFLLCTLEDKDESEAEGR